MTRTSEDRLDELRTIFLSRYMARLHEEFDQPVADFHDADPLCILDDKTNRVLRFLRGQSITGKHLIYAVGPNGPWRLGVVTHGVPGNLLLLDGSFADYRSAMRAIFDDRRSRFQAAVKETDGCDDE